MQQQQSWWSSWTTRFGRRSPEPAADASPPEISAVMAAEKPPVAATTPDYPALVEAMLGQDRYALLLRPQIKEGLSAEQFSQARDALERSMARIPAGFVDMGDRTSETATQPAALEHVDSALIDRYPVTNRQFRQFIEAGGYDLLALWDPEAWPALVEFVDQSGVPGPRYWRNGRYGTGEDEYPVVGVNWFEAAAYSRWVGKRLPSDSEWVKAAGWPVPLSDTQVTQRRYPWGDTMDRGRCNVWGSGPARTVAITQFSAGVSVGGVYQLIGNVWEWTNSGFEENEGVEEPLELSGPMKSIRGGAFDTYFEHQACCDFRSGEYPLSRKHNIGFRCALSYCDVASAPAIATGANG